MTSTKQPSVPSTAPKNERSKLPRRQARPATVRASVDAFLAAMALARSANTTRAYKNGLQAFLESLRAEAIDPAAVSPARAEEDWLLPFASALKGLAPASERLYLTAVTGWYEYLAAERLAPVNLAPVSVLIRPPACRDAPQPPPLRPPRPPPRSRRGQEGAPHDDDNGTGHCPRSISGSAWRRGGRDHPPLVPPLFRHHRSARLRRQPQAGPGAGPPPQHRRHPALRASLRRRARPRVL